MPKVFISYSHDSETHKARVLALAQALRRHGIDVELDQFHTHRIVDWPNWCREQMQKADIVLCICTTDYRNRINRDAPPEEGKGVYWEGTLLIKEFYRKKGNDRFLAVLLAPESKDSIPDFLQNETYCQLTNFDKSDAGFVQLYRILTGQPGAVPEPLGPVWHLNESGYVDTLATKSETGTTSDPAKSATGKTGSDSNTNRRDSGGNTKWYWRTWVAALLLVIAGLTAWWLWFIPWRELQAAQAEYDHGNLVGARGVLEAHPQRWENNAAAQFLLGVIAMRQDESQRALMYYERAARLDSSAPQYRGNLATTKLRIDDSPKSRKEAQKVFADILDGSQPFMLAAVEWLRLELLRDRGPDWAAINSRIAIGDNWMNEAAMNQPWNRLFWRFPDQTGEMQRLIYDNDNPVKRDDRQCYWYHLKLLTMYLHKTGPLPAWHDQCLVSQPARIVLAADILRIKLAHPEWQTRLHEAAAEMGLPGSTDI